MHACEKYARAHTHGVQQTCPKAWPHPVNTTLTRVPFRAPCVCPQHDFKVLYDSTMGIIRKNEKAGFAAFTAVAKTMRSQCPDECPRNPADLFDLYASGRVAYDLFHAFLEQVAI